MPRGYVGTTDVRTWHQVFRRAAQWSQLLSKSPAEVSGALKFDYSMSQIS